MLEVVSGKKRKVREVFVRSRVLGRKISRKRWIGGEFEGTGRLREID